MVNCMENHQINNQEDTNTSSNNYIVPNDIYVLSEKDFYPPEDNRYYKSNVYNIYGGDTFFKYAKEFFQYIQDSFEDMYEE